MSSTIEESSELLPMMEERRKTAEGALWQLPGLSVAAQAFLLGAALQAEAPGWARVLAGLVGALTVVATALVVAFQAARLSLLGSWIEDQLGTPLDEVTLATQLRRRRLNRLQTAFLRLPTPLWFWAVALAGFLAADAVVLCKGL